MLVFGFPLLYLETILGQYARGGPITAWGVVPLMKGKYFKIAAAASTISVPIPVFI